MQSSIQQLAVKAPRFHLFTQSRSSLVKSAACKRNYSADNSNPFSGFRGGPAPPRLPKEEQDIFEELQRQSTGAFSTPRSPPKINQSPDSTSTEQIQAEKTTADRAANMSSQANMKEEFKKIIEARGKGEELHPNVRRGAPPEFEGDVNPKTGEVGGPKNEPLRWGASGEWSYNGRTTDF